MADLDLEDIQRQVRADAARNRRETASVPGGVTITPRPRMQDLPPGAARGFRPPASLVRELDNDRGGRACAGRYEITWEDGDLKGLPLTGYCAEPLCVTNGGTCSAPRFVPHLQQYTAPEGDPGRRPRRPEPAELVLGARRLGEAATRETGVPDTRTDRGIARHIGLTWNRMRAAMGKGRRPRTAGGLFLP